MKGLPEEGQGVYVIAPTGTTLSARVRAVEDTHILLSFTENMSSPVSMLAGGNVAVQYTNRRGVCRVDGAAHAASDADLRVEYTSKVQLIQRREHVRIDAMVRVTYHPIGPSGWEAETTTINISGGGFMLSGREGLQLGNVLDFTLGLDGEDNKDAGELAVVGEVVRETAGGLGIRIVEIDENERERLIRWVFTRERIGLQMVRGR